MAARGTRGSSKGSDYEESYENDELRREIAELKEFVGKLAQASSMEHIFIKGFETIKDTLDDKLTPLRELTFERTALPDEAVNRLRDIRVALARPSFTQEQPLPSSKAFNPGYQAAKEQAS